MAVPNGMYRFKELNASSVTLVDLLDRIAES